jgi:hypothetical protein
LRGQGQAGGTWEAFRTALSIGKLVIPFANTGTDVQHAAVLLEIFGQDVPMDLLNSTFEDESGAQRTGKLLEQMLVNIDARGAAKEVDNRDLLWMCVFQ